MKNPFGSSNKVRPVDAGQVEPASPRPSSGWAVVRGLLLGLLLLVTVGFQLFELWQWRWTAQRQSEALGAIYASWRGVLEKARDYRDGRDEFQKEIEEATRERNRLDSRLQQLQEEKEKASENQRKLEEEMRAALESKDVTISELAGKLTVNILDRVLFASGEAEIKEEGQAVLRHVAEVLSSVPERQIQVIGHTDNVPIATSRFPSNWELSAARALAAVRFLAEEAGVDPKRLGALAQGEFHPIADNSTLEGRSRNRRIAIVVLPVLLSNEPAETGTDFPVEQTGVLEAEVDSTEDVPEGPPGP